MKIKNDFITNSSSTSFIIASKDDKEDLSEINYTMKINLLNALEDRISIRTIKDLDNNIEKTDMYYDKLKSIIENGGVAYLFEVGSHDGNWISYYIYNKRFDTNKLENKNLIYINLDGDNT